MHRRAEAAIATGGALAGLAAFVAWRALWHEPRADRVRERDLALPRWPPAVHGLRVALVSDLHAGAPHVHEERLEGLVETVNAQAPDLVLLLGDFVDPNVRGATPIAPEAVAARLAGLTAPLGVLAVLGNHDWLHEGRRVARALDAAGIPVLENDALDLGGLWLAGVADARSREPDIDATLRLIPPDAPVILMSHDPDLFPRVPPRVALTVSGHTHGGQVAIPRLRRRVIPSRYGERYASGHVVEGGRHLYVTAGYGTSGWPVRLFAPSEIVVLRLTSAS
jgi:uncharacterized protein